MKACLAGLAMVAVVCVLAVATLVTSSCDAGGCSCDWEGPVDWTMTSAGRYENLVLVTGTVEWEPCCKDRTTRQMTFVIDVSQCQAWVAGVDLEADEPAGGEPQKAEPLELPQSSTDSLRIDIEGCDKRIELMQSAEDVVSIEWLKIGVLLDSSDSELAGVVIHVPQEQN